MYEEDDFLPISGLQHMAFCERRWALVQIEGLWEENRFTAEGRLIHEKAHSGGLESRPGTLTRRTIPLHSFRLGLSGQADIIEFQLVPENQPGISLDGRKGRWRPFPVEYKRSRDRFGSLAYSIQLCAQALCLEEMFGLELFEGAVYDAKSRRRHSIVFDTRLKDSVCALAARMHELFRNRATPPPVYKPACHKCSLIGRCLPEVIGARRPVAAYHSLAGEDG